MPFYELKTTLASRLAAHLAHPEITPDFVESEFSHAPTGSRGHLALPLFRIAKLVGKTAARLTDELVSRLSGPDLSVSGAGPYVLFRWPLARLARETLDAIACQKERYGRDSSGRDECIVLEFSSPNLTRTLAVSHLRSTLVGNALANVFDALGYRTERLNFVGDGGPRFSRLMAAVEQWGDRRPRDPGARSRRELVAEVPRLHELFARYQKETASAPELEATAARFLDRLAAGDETALTIWRDTRAAPLAALDEILLRLGVRFDHTEGTSQYLPALRAAAEEVKVRAHARSSDGAWLVDVEGQPAPALIQKRDGTTLNLTRDCAAAADRFRRFGFRRMLYVVSGEQRLHFDLLFGVLRKMGYPWADRLKHLPLGPLSVGGEKVRPRAGSDIPLMTFLDEAVTTVRAELATRHPELPEARDVAERLGVATVAFATLGSPIQRELELDLKTAVSFDGETGPFVLFTLSRCRALLARARQKGEAGLAAPVEHLPEPVALEETLVFQLARFREALHEVRREEDPFPLAHYLIDLSRAFHRFSYQVPIVQANDPLQRRFRVALAHATEQVLANGLGLLSVRPLPGEP